MLIMIREKTPLGLEGMLVAERFTEQMERTW